MVIMASAYVSNDEFWRVCANWLTQWEVLRTDHRANWPNATIVDLANTLRDGVLLCTLLSKLDPGCIDMKEVHLKPTMAQFLCKRNIERFLYVCSTIFGLKENDLFEPMMLFELTNFHKVLCTLSKLSLSPKALRSNIPGFSDHRTKTKEEEEIYQSLSTVDIRQPSNCVVEPSWLQFTIPCPRPEDKEEELYDDLCYVTFSTCLPEFAQTQTPFEKRDHVIKELIDTERNYVDVLTKLKKNFMKPLQNILNPTVHGVVFCRINELHEIHTGFLSQLLKVNNSDITPSVRLSDIFMRWREKFLVYGEYCANLSTSCTILQETCDNDEHINQAVINYEKEDNNGKFKLRDVLSVPMQRILKYHLLLDKLIEFTDPNHEESKELKRAREAMLDVAGYINEAARDSEHIAVINKLQDNIVEWVLPSEIRLISYGRLIKDGELKIKAHDDQKTKSRYVFIFDKAMFLFKQLKGNQFAYRDILNLSEYHVDEFNSRAVLTREARWAHHWLLVKHDNSTGYTLSVRSAEIKAKMMKALNEAIENTTPICLRRSTHKFELHTFDKPEACNHCSKYLKGLIHQGYWCSVCKIGVHKECIANCGRCGLPRSTPQQNFMSEMKLQNKLWFAGEMSRNDASDLLENRINGTYLVRIRPQSNSENKFAISLKTDNAVKHMKIWCRRADNEEKYFLSQSKFFNSVEELINNYHFHSLKENFVSLEENTKLEWPYRQIKAYAVKDFEPHDRAQIRLREGHTVVVISKEGYREGWWMGKSENMVGFFPCSYIREEGMISYDLN